MSSLSSGQEEKEKKDKEIHKINLEEIIVTAKKDTISETAMVNEVSAEDIEAANAQTLADAVKSLPGIDITVGSKNEHRPYLRGFDNKRITILLDGMPIYEPYNHSIDTEQLSVDSIEKIKVVRGGSSVLYGPDSMGGVINIITTKAKEKYRFKWSSFYSNYRTHHHQIAQSISGEHGGLYISSSYARSTGFRLSSSFKPGINEDGGKRENSNYSRLNLFGKLSWTPKEEQTYSLAMGYYSSEYGIPAHTDMSIAKFRRFIDWGKYYFDANGQINTGARISLKFKLFYHRYNNIMQDFADNTYQTVRWESEYDNYSIGGIAHAFVDLADSHHMRIGFNLRRDAVSIQDDIELPWKRYHQNVSSIAVEDEFPLRKKLFLVAGTSVDFLTKKGAQESAYSLNPMLGFNYYVNPSMNIHGTISHKSRFPSLRELYSATSGNPQLKAEEAIIWEAGISWSIQNHHNIELAFFWNRVWNLIDRRYLEWGWGVYENIEKARMRGLEIFGNFFLSSSISLSANYTFLDAVNLSKAQPLEYRPKHKLNFDVRLLFPEYLNIIFQSSSAAESYHFYEDGKLKVPSYTVNNLRFEREIMQHLKTFFFIENLFDVSYYKEEGFPWRGRTLMLGFILRI